MLQLENKIKGAIYGLLIGDAVGVPYEFHLAHQIPHIDEIDMRPPENFDRSYPSIAAGTWSDDGAQALCLLSSLLVHQQLNVQDFMSRLSQWYNAGYMAVDGHVFDVGVQTAEAIRKYLLGVPLMQIAPNDEHANGNGALMRVLPLALWHQGSDQQLIEDAYLQSHITHGHLRSKVCCALYCLWARYILKGVEIQQAWVKALEVLREYYQHCPLDAEQLEFFIRPDEILGAKGSGYVVDCLRSARFALQQPTYEGVIKAAIALGHDTDTTACVAGGIAGLYYGFNALPQHWYEQLRAKEVVEPLVDSLIKSIRENGVEASGYRAH